LPTVIPLGATSHRCVPSQADDAAVVACDDDRPRARAGAARVRYGDRVARITVDRAAVRPVAGEGAGVGAVTGMLEIDEHGLAIRGHDDTGRLLVVGSAEEATDLARDRVGREHGIRAERAARLLRAAHVGLDPENAARV